MTTDLCYLLHFSQPVGHARHYLGTAADVPRRLALHRAGRSRVKLIDAAVAKGVTLTLVRLWMGGRLKERELKNRKEGPQLCPVCNARLHLPVDEAAAIARFDGGRCGSK